MVDGLESGIRHGNPAFPRHAVVEVVEPGDTDPRRGLSRRPIVEADDFGVGAGVDPTVDHAGAGELHLLLRRSKLGRRRVLAQMKDLAALGIEHAEHRGDAPNLLPGGYGAREQKLHQPGAAWLRTRARRSRSDGSAAASRGASAAITSSSSGRRSGSVERT